VCQACPRGECDRGVQLSRTCVKCNLLCRQTRHLFLVQAIKVYVEVPKLNVREHRYKPQINFHRQNQKFLYFEFIFVN
jgi:hypothetical protein